ncbi:hypothetical protein KAX29_04290 [candidate division WOR-3 bacterium]|nr:hypothetical protein [candidate division WOR-3 bacterium]
MEEGKGGANITWMRLVIRLRRRVGKPSENSKVRIGVIENLVYVTVK